MKMTGGQVPPAWSSLRVSLLARAWIDWALEYSSRSPKDLISSIRLGSPATRPASRATEVRSFMMMEIDGDNWWEYQFNGSKAVYWRLALPLEIWTGATVAFLYYLTS